MEEVFGFNLAEELEKDSVEKKSKSKKNKQKSGFEKLNLSEPVLKGIKSKGYKYPTPIQQKSIPMIMGGRDVVAMARTGSGKTAAFLIPMFENLKCEHSTKVGVRALVLAPTRELVLQTHRFIKDLVGETTELRSCTIVGGDSMDDQFSALANNPDIIVAAPGRLLHIISETGLSLKAVQYVVFDEADRLFEMGFRDQLYDIISRIPSTRQTVLVSATMPTALAEFAKVGLKNPEIIRLDSDTKINDKLKLSFFNVRTGEKEAALLFLLRDVIGSKKSVIVFCSTKHHVDYLFNLLGRVDIESTTAYGNLDQEARKNNLQKFKSGKVQILLVTDLAARGIDIPVLDVVINYDFPTKPKTFVHRVGRAARAGRSGTAYSLVTPDELGYMIDLHLFLGRPLWNKKEDQPAKLETDEEDKRSKSQKRKDRPYDNGFFGSIPQLVLDALTEEVVKLLNDDKALEAEKQVSERAFKLYKKSAEEQPSAESIRRGKSMKIAIHPFIAWKLGINDAELIEKQSDLVSQIRNYRPSTTVFEMGEQGSEQADIMRKRRVYRGNIAAFKTSSDNAKEGNRMSDEIDQSVERNAFETKAKIEMQQVREAITKPKSKGTLADLLLNPERKNKRFFTLSQRNGQMVEDETKKKDFKDSEFYLSYSKTTAAEAAEERGYAVNPEKQQVFTSVVENEAPVRLEEMVNDLIPEDMQAMNNKNRTILRWDKKKKKYVRTHLAAGEKIGVNGKIKTESGAKISKKDAKNKDFYQKWKSKTHARIQGVGETEADQAVAPKKKNQNVGRSSDDLGMADADDNNRNNKKNDDKRGQKRKREPKNELKSEAQIKKVRRDQEKKQYTNQVREKIKKVGYHKVKEELVRDGQHKARLKREAQSVFNKNAKVKVRIIKKRR